MVNPKQWAHMSATGTKVLATHQAALGSVIVNTAAASAVLTIYDNSAGSGDTVAVIDCSTLSNPRIYDSSLANGLTAVMSGGNADVTITYEGSV